MKYILKNCPAILEYKKEYYCAELNNLDDLKQVCVDCTDCLLKQIVEKCKGVQEKFYDAVHSRYLSPSKAKFAREILNLLQIQEVDNE